MEAMKDFVIWFIQSIPAFLLTPPISAFVGMALLAFTVNILRRMMRLQKGGIQTSSPAAGTMASLVASAGEIVTEALSWVSEVATTITSTPLILLFILVAFVGLGVGLIRRMMKL